MRPSKVSIALTALAVLIIGITFIRDSVPTYAYTSAFVPGYTARNCDDFADNGIKTDRSCAPNLAADAAADITRYFDIPLFHSNFSLAVFGTPADAYVAGGGAIDLGAKVGVVYSPTELGLNNGACNTFLSLEFPQYNAETDTGKTAAAWPEGKSKRLGILMMVDLNDDDGDGMYSDDGKVGEESTAAGAPAGLYTAGDDDGDTLVNEDPPELARTNSTATTTEAIDGVETNITVSANVFAVNDRIMVEEAGSANDELMTVTATGALNIDVERSARFASLGTTGTAHTTGKVINDLGASIAGDFLQNHVRYTPSYNNEVFDPDLNGNKLDLTKDDKKPPIRPYARYSSSALVGGEPVVLQLAVFQAGGLTGFPTDHNFNEVGTDMGYVDEVLLQDPSASVPSPSGISAFCAPLGTTTILFGTTLAGPGGQPGGDIRYRNPSAGTGLVDPATGLGTNSHLNVLYGQGYRDLDADGVVNGDTYDTCASLANNTPQDSLRNLTVNLGGAVGDTAVTVNDGSDLQPNVTIRIEAEQMLIVSKVVNVLTVLRGQNGTARVAHAQPKDVFSMAWEPSAARPQAVFDDDLDGIPDEPVTGCDNVQDGTTADNESTIETNCADAVDNDLDGRINDNCTQGGTASEINQCDNATNDDGDAATSVNDGCPTVLGVAESNQCDDATNDDGGGTTSDNRDAYVNDGCPQVGATAETGTQCDNATDDDVGDADATVNDGCLAVGGPEQVQCGNATDDDRDSRVNDGCPADGAAEIQQCDNALNDADAGTADALINDGCFIDISLGVHGDDFTNGDDNCPVVFNALQSEDEGDQTYLVAAPAGGPRGDGMGNDCDADPTHANGPYRAYAAISSVCILPGVDTDGDGYCDATETALGSLPGNILSTPEADAVHPPFPVARAGATFVAPATDGVPTACTDGVDNDLDGSTDVEAGCGSAGDLEMDGIQTNGADSTADLNEGGGDGNGLTAAEAAATVTDGTQFTIGQFIVIDSEAMKVTNIVGNVLTLTRGQRGTTGATHADPANIFRSRDNCAGSTPASNYNPTQTDYDLDGVGDACDADRDNDGRTNLQEQWTGTDVNDDCADVTTHDANTFDVTKNRTIDVTDLLGAPNSFKNSFGATQGQSKYLRRFDFDANQTIDVTDLLGATGSFKSNFGTTCLNLSEYANIADFAQSDIIDGLIDVNESGTVTAADDLNNVVLNLLAGGSDQVDIIDGQVDVNESGTITAADDLANVVLSLAAGGTDQVDIIDGNTDVNEDAAITATDDLNNVVLVVGTIFCTGGCGIAVTYDAGTDTLTVVNTWAGACGPTLAAVGVVMFAPAGTSVASKAECTPSFIQATVFVPNLWVVAAAVLPAGTPPKCTFTFTGGAIGRAACRL